MRNKIIQYFLIFISLIALYLFVSDLNKTEAFAASKERMTNRIEKLKDSIAQLVTDQTEHAYFSLALNRDAQQAHPDLSPDDSATATRGVFARTKRCAQWQPFTLLNGKGWIVNKISIVNHQWILADFTQWQSVG